MEYTVVNASVALLYQRAYGDVAILFVFTSCQPGKFYPYIDEYIEATLKYWALILLN